jgi:putative ABC transport system permease protein
MSRMKGVRARLSAILRPRAAEARMEEEFHFHLEMEIDRNLRAGMTPAEARRRALVAFGGLDSHREAMRDGRGARLVGDLGRDVRVALRGLARNPGFATVAVLTIGIGVGATTAVFSAVDAALLRPLPFAEPDRLVELDDVNIPHRSEGEEPLKRFPDITDVRALTDTFTHVAAYAPGGMNLSGLGTPRRIRVGVVTPNLFATLGVPPLLGRDLTADEEVPGAPRVALVSYALWRTAMGGDSDIAGRTIRLNGHTHEVVGVMPRGFAFPDEAEVWVPMSVPLTSASFEAFRQYIPSREVARLASGVTIEQAGARVRALLGPLRPDRPVEATSAELVRPLQASLVGNGGSALLVLLGATALVLLVACTNVANLLLSRAVARRHEIALRAMLGASSSRLIRQLLAESILLALIGGVAGVAIAVMGAQLLDVLVPSALSGAAPIRVDTRVLGFALAVAVTAGLAFGLWPALTARHTSAAGALKSGGAGPGGDTETSRLHRLCVVGEVALALMLLIGSSLMLRSLDRLLSTESGVQPEGVATLELALARAEYSTTEARRQFYEAVLDRLRRDPQVVAAAAINELPLRGQWGVAFLIYPEGPRPEPERLQYAQDLRVTPDYFRTMGIRILAGRPPGAQPAGTEVGEVAINEALADAYWPGQSPIGARLQWPNDTVYEVVGVVSNVRPGSLDDEVIPQAYYSLLDTPYPNAALVARGRISAEGLIGSLQQAVRAVAPGQAVYNVRTMEEVIAGAIAPRRTRTVLITTFGLVALCLAAVGVYGVIAFGVARRTREIGIRLALGANPGRVIGGVVAEGLVLALAGTVPGLAGAWLLSRFLESFVYGITTTDPVAFTAAPVALLAIATLAALVPAWRASRVNAVEAMRVG